VVVRSVEEPSLPTLDVLRLGKCVGAIDEVLARSSGDTKETQSVHSIRKLASPLPLVIHKALELLSNTRRRVRKVNIALESEDIGGRGVSIPIEIDIPNSGCIILSTTNGDTVSSLSESFRSRVSANERSEVFPPRIP